MTAITICNDFWAPQNKVCHCFHCFPIYLPWNDGTGCHDLSFLNAEFQVSFFILLFHLHQEALYYLFTFCHKCSVTCISEVIHISPGNLDSSLCFIQSSILHDVLCIACLKHWNVNWPWDENFISPLPEAHFSNNLFQKQIFQRNTKKCYSKLKPVQIQFHWTLIEIGLRWRSLNVPDKEKSR